ncbi:MAG TPA: hypothetical protein VFN72_09725 [Solirubrobacterales bacterium]|nr:hypothetical protein [Solirubrobacterales bacterium]
MDTGILTKHHVRFLGPALTRRSRGALSAAAITLVDRRPAEGWANQLQEYLVLVEARDRCDAVARVQKVIEAHGFYNGFEPVPPPA